MSNAEVDVPPSPLWPILGSGIVPETHFPEGISEEQRNDLIEVMQGPVQPYVRLLLDELKSESGFALRFMPAIIAAGTVANDQLDHFEQVIGREYFSGMEKLASVIGLPSPCSTCSPAFEPEPKGDSEPVYGPWCPRCLVAHGGSTGVQTVKAVLGYYVWTKCLHEAGFKWKTESSAAERAARGQALRKDQVDRIAKHLVSHGYKGATLHVAHRAVDRAVREQSSVTFWSTIGIRSVEPHPKKTPKWRNGRPNGAWVVHRADGGDSNPGCRQLAEAVVRATNDAVKQSDNK